MSPFAVELLMTLLNAAGALCGSFILLSGTFTIYHARRALKGFPGFEDKYREDLRAGVLFVLAGLFILIFAVWR